MIVVDLWSSYHYLGNSRVMAKRRFLTVERKLQQNKQLTNDYRLFMKKYVVMKHMKVVSSNGQPIHSTYYLPHHAVIKSDSLTTKTSIVVFDASVLTTSELSLNVIMMRGATVQPTLFSILFRFRIHNIVFTTTLKKCASKFWLTPKIATYNVYYIDFNPSNHCKNSNYQL